MNLLSERFVLASTSEATPCTVEQHKTPANKWALEMGEGVLCNTQIMFTHFEGLPNKKNCLNFPNWIRI